MRAAAATAGMVSAAVLLAPGCGDPAPRQMEREEPVRRASFRSLAAREFLYSCPGGAVRAETARQGARFDELKQLAVRNGAGHAVWLGENDWAGVERYSKREPCAAGEAPYGEALAAYGGTLDVLATQIADFAR